MTSRQENDRHDMELNGSQLEKSSFIKKNRVGQLILKTAIRNHVDLATLVDNKASIMLGINTFILTLTIPLMIPRIQDTPSLLYPTIVLITSCVLSMLYATLVIKPVKMKGVTDAQSIEQGKGNLFFFGNFFKMNFEEYYQGIKSTLSSPENLDESVIRDLFQSGIALGSKYSKMRICYIIFIGGLILSFMGFIYVIAFHAL